MILTKIVEKASAIAFKEFKAQRVFKPLEMSHTLANDDITTIIKNRPRPYNPRNPLYKCLPKRWIFFSKTGEWIQHHRNAPHYGGSGIISTIDDLINWEKNFFSQKFGGTEFYALMHQTMEFNHHRTNQAFGLYFGKYKERRFVAWDGGTYGISSQIIRFPDQKVAIIALSNLGSGEASNQANRIADILIDAGEQ